MGSIIAMVNMKGGVGKTTVTVNLATCLAKYYKKRVLVLDLDSQINATLSLMPPLRFAKLKRQKRTLRTLLNQVLQPNTPGKIKTYDIIQRNICQIQGLDLIAGDIELYHDFLLAQTVYSQSSGTEKDFEQKWQDMESRLLKEVVSPLSEFYDIILMDFSPGDHLITRSGILASDFYIIPAKAEPLSVVGIGILQGRIKQLKENNTCNINHLGIVFTSTGRNSVLSDQIKKRLGQDFGNNTLFETEIPMNVAVARAVDEFKPVVLTEPNSPGAKAFIALAKEFVKRHG